MKKILPYSLSPSWLLPALAPAMAGCRGMQSVLDPAGPLAARIGSLWWLMLIVCGLVYLLVIAVLLYTVARWRRREKEWREAPAPLEPLAPRRMGNIIAMATGVTTLILFVFLFADFATGRALNGIARSDSLTIELTGYQWWWEVKYIDTVSSRRVTTANEIHIPVGRPVRIRGKSGDVIHSFWVPNLQGKRDLIPGYTTALWLQADSPGVYRGQCAEFCGAAHAKMALMVVAESPEKFRAWYNHQLEPAPPPADSLQLRGEQVFLSSPCVMCHNIGGSIATGQVAPDLTHVASRLTLAAGALPNRPGHLAGWIVDPQSVKPGSHMPPNMLRPDELQALLAYLESLK